MCWLIRYQGASVTKTLADLGNEPAALRETADDQCLVTLQQGKYWHIFSVPETKQESFTGGIQMLQVLAAFNMSPPGQTLQPQGPGQYPALKRNHEFTLYHI
ncbi:MAG: hypothetical protein JRJ16_17335 [Deltaproteobacteria bacterium]|nr:hypothetical protein [Deltaproteobacteria bacterium]